MATGKKDGEGMAELEAAIEAVRRDTLMIGQTLPKLRHAIVLILRDFKAGPGTRRGRPGHMKV